MSRIPTSTSPFSSGTLYEFDGGGGAHVRCNIASGLGKLTILPSKRWWPIRSVGLPFEKNERERDGQTDLRDGLREVKVFWDARAHLAIVCIVDCEATDELPVLVARDFELALEFE